MYPSILHSVTPAPPEECGGIGHPRPSDQPDVSAPHSDNAPAETEQPYPEGGRKAWLVTFGSFCALLASFGIMNSIGALQTHLSGNQLRGHSEGEIGWIFGVYAFTCFLGGVQVGPMFDHYGPKWLMAGGSALLVTGMMLLSVSTSYWQFMLSFGILSGVGTSLIFTPAITSVGHWFRERRGCATGLASAGGSAGGIVFPLIIQAVVPRAGFGWAVRIVAFICCFLLVIANLLVRVRPGCTDSPDPPLPSPVACAPTSEKSPQNPPARNKRPNPAFTLDLTSFRSPLFTLTTLGVFMIEWGIFIPLTYITSHALSPPHPLPAKISYKLLPILNLGSLFGRWLPPLASDRVGRFNAMIVTVAFNLTVVALLWLLPTATGSGGSGREATMVAFALLYGFGSGSGITLSSVCVGQICKTSEYGSKYGTCYFFVSFGILTGIPVAGQIVHVMGGDYVGLITFTVASYVAALACFLAARIVGAGTALRKVY